MMKAIIVDDEYFVRKGFMQIIPWEELGIEIIGEAANGEIALELMKQCHVDLVLTDLTMPVMNGFELIKQVREHYLGTWIAVLTCHQDFHHIQEAVRLGAIDYVVKTELEDDTLNKSIARIIERIRLEEKRKLELQEQQQEEDEPWALFLTPVTNEANWELPFELVMPSCKSRVITIQKKGIYVRREDLLQKYTNIAMVYAAMDWNQWIPIMIRGVRNLPEKVMVQLLTRYRDEKLFFDFQSQKTGYEIDWNELETKPVATDDAVMQVLKQQWRSYYWVYHDGAFHDLMDKVRERKPAVSVWIEHLRNTVLLWRHFESISESTDWAAASEELLFWEQWIDWLGLVRLRLRHHELSEDVCIGILRAMQMISIDLQSSMNQTEVAKRINLNRSYLSRCFKQYVGKPFQDVLNDLRVEKATELLATTNEPVYQIAEKTGFQDEKYFSKFYKQQTGRLPKHVRKE
ncbi:helix-turn-helix domain-containing protein [Paenibacillus sp. CF384]|uniref:response regulator transcription factor n=1 Tax=Paenibacillus sp. CF384 TaxID=1884382 RepID=UPI0008946EAC|nr:helix-turn-helix domain-containing protein [Paenibacillus sp. CF384]SDX99135.1 two-component system, response regulator YesN [Paenibacillus sp. CF384]